MIPNAMGFPVFHAATAQYGVKRVKEKLIK
jgi:hypothetical protein